MGDYSFYRKITVDKTEVAETDPNFAVLLNLTAAGSGVIADLKTTGNGGDIQNTASGGASGSHTVPADLTFRTSADMTQAGAGLDFEITFYDPATGALIAWVQSGVDTAADTDIYMIYGNAQVTTSQENVTGTWQATYKAVWHFSETSGDYADSTGNSHDSTTVSVTSRTATGVVHYCPEFNPNNYVAFPTSSDWLFGSGDYTLELWVLFDAVPGSGQSAGLMFWGAMDPLWGVLLYGPTTSAIVSMIRNGTQAWYQQDCIPSADTWYHLVFTKDGDVGEFYVDGSSIGSGTDDGTVEDSNESLRLGCSGNGAGLWERYLNGNLDEVRISKGIARSANYVTTAHNNQSSPSTFYSVGAEQQPSPAQPYGFIM